MPLKVESFFRRVVPGQGHCCAVQVLAKGVASGAQAHAVTVTSAKVTDRKGALSA